MSIFSRAMDRLADFIWTGRKVNLRFTAEYRTACYAVPDAAGLYAACRCVGGTRRWHTVSRQRCAPAADRQEVRECRHRRIAGMDAVFAR